MTEVFHKELQGYLRSMIGWVFMAFLFLVTGIYTMVYNLYYQYVNFEYVLGSLGFVFLIMVPILSMNVLAGERRNKTDQFLLTSPLSVHEIVLGKYLAMAAVLAIPLLVVCLYPLLFAMFGNVSLGVCYGAALAVFFMGAAVLSIGLFVSSLTENQVISAVITFGAMLLLYWIQDLADLLPASAAFSLVAFTILVIVLAIIIRQMMENTVIASVVAVLLEAGIIVTYLVNPSLFEGAFTAFVSSLALFGKLDNFIYGIFDVNALVYYLSVTGLFLFFTVQQIEARRWK